MVRLHGSHAATRNRGSSPVTRRPRVWCTHVATPVHTPGSRTRHRWRSRSSTAARMRRHRRDDPVFHEAPTCRSVFYPPLVHEAVLPRTHVHQGIPVPHAARLGVAVSAGSMRGTPVELCRSAAVGLEPREVGSAVARDAAGLTLGTEALRLGRLHVGRQLVEAHRCRGGAARVSRSSRPGARPQCRCYQDHRK